MNYNELRTALEATGYPVAEGAFSASDHPEMPYITYARTGDRAFYADGTVYWYTGAVEIHLYTSKKDAAAEAAMRQALANVAYAWTEERNPAQSCYDVTIKMEV